MKKIFLTLSVAFAVLAISAQGTAKTTDTKKDSKTTATTKKTDAKPAPASKTADKKANTNSTAKPAGK